MSHTSLYRRFRPDSFDKMVRQEHVVRILKNQIEAGTIGHAYLFTGPRGTGKTSIARIFARAVNCENPQDGSPCGKCPSCLALEKGSLDVTEIDAASNNGVNEMRDLREKVQYPPVTGRYKVYIIDEVHMLTDSAFNALLKTLEEPPAHAIFILATTEPQKLPATILSRCMRLDFKLIPEEDLEKHLMRVLDEIGKPYEREAVAAIARAGAGSDRDMLSIAEMCIAYGDKLTYEGVTAVLGAADFHETCALVSALLSADSGSALERTERILSEGKAVGVLCRDILELLNQVTVAKTCPAAEKLLSLPKALFAEVKKVANGADGKAILRAAEIFARTETELRYASSPRITLETAVMRVSMPAQDYDIEALLVRMNALERELQELKEKGISVAATATPAEPVAAPAPPVVPQTEPKKSVQGEFCDDFGPLPEEPVFEEAYFSDPPSPKTQPAPRSEQEKGLNLVETLHDPEFNRKIKEERAAGIAKVANTCQSLCEESGHPVPKELREVTSEINKTAEPAPQPVPAQPTTGLTAQQAFGQFMRTLRKTSKSGVLFTMCSDLEAVFEGGKLVLLTTSEMILRSLKREDHMAVMSQVFNQINVPEFEVRLKGAEPAKTDGIEQLMHDFSGYPIEKK